MQMNHSLTSPRQATEAILGNTSTTELGKN